MNCPIKSTGKNIVSAQRRCSIIYSSLQLLRRKERSTSAPPCGPAQKRPLARLAFQPALAHSAQPCYLRTVRKVFGPPKSGSIPPIGSSGTPIFSGRDARHSDLPWGGTRGWGRSLGLVKNGLFWVKVGHFFFYKGRRGSDLLRAQTRGSTARVIRRVFTVHTSAECV